VSFTLWATPFVGFVSVIPAAFLNQVRVDVSRSLDTIGGGNYANTTLIRWTTGSAGWQFDAAVGIGSGGTLTVASGGTLVTAAGSTTTLNGDATLNATLTVSGTGEILVLASGSITLNSGANLDVAGTLNATNVVNLGASSVTTLLGTFYADTGAFVTIAAGANLNVFGSATVKSGGVFTVDLGGTATVDGSLALSATSSGTCLGAFSYGSGAILTCASGSIVNHASGSAETHASGSVDSYSSGSSLTHDSGSTETYAAGAIVADGATTTRTGSVKRSGAGAWELPRLVTGADADATIATSANDVTLVPAITSPRAWQLDDPGGAPMKGLQHTIRRHTSATGSPLDIFDAPSGGILLRFNGTTNTYASMTFEWDGANWFTLSWSSYNAATGGPTTGSPTAYINLG
jgi:hypothetical protein